MLSIKCDLEAKVLQYNLRWYGKPCNIYKDERILKYGYIQPQFNLSHFAPNNALIKFHK